MTEEGVDFHATKDIDLVLIIEVYVRTLWKTMKIEHITLYVKDLETARNFFVKYLGTKSNEGYHNLKTSFRSYFLSFDDGARLEIMNKPEMPDFPKELFLRASLNSVILRKASSGGNSRPASISSIPRSNMRRR